MSELLVEGHGLIVAEFFDEGVSRRRRWSNRPEGARLLEALADPERGFEAVVVGGVRACVYGRQFDEMVPLLRAAGVQVWLPEVAGPVDLDDGEHRRLMRFLGAQSQREVIRARNRSLRSMKVQAELGRYLPGERAGRAGGARAAGRRRGWVACSSHSRRSGRLLRRLFITSWVYGLAGVWCG